MKRYVTKDCAGHLQNSLMTIGASIADWLSTRLVSAHGDSSLLLGGTGIRWTVSVSSTRRSAIRQRLDETWEYYVASSLDASKQSAGSFLQSTV
jgi:hypothetical protein